MVKVPVDLGKYGAQKGFYCMEEVTLTKNWTSKYPVTQIQIRKIGDGFDLDDENKKDKIVQINQNIGYSLFYMNTPPGRMGAAAQGLGQVG